MALMPWATHTLQWAGQRGAKGRPGANPSKPAPSGDRRLQPASVNAESLVTAGQPTAVNTFPGLVHTARHVMGAGDTRRRWANPQGGQVTRVGPVTGTKS
jgi:hypothetical protein